MLTTTELALLVTCLFGSSAGLLTVFIEIVSTWHTSRMDRIKKRSEEFLELSRKYYSPLAILVGGIQGETEDIDKVRLKILFFKLAKYLNFIQKFSDEVGAIFIFPTQTLETKVAHYSTLLNSTINYLIFKDNREDMERVINYYKTYSNILSFVDDIENLPEYKTFESICNQKSIIRNLSKYSRELRESIYEGITEEYKVWYKIEFYKNVVKTTYDVVFNKEKNDINDEYKAILNKK